MFKKAISYYFKWLRFFFIGRLLQLYFHWNMLDNNDLSSIVASFYKGIRLDLSIISYVFLPLLFLLFVYTYFNNKIALTTFLYRVMVAYNALLLFVFAILISAEITTYYEWKSKLQYKALLHLLNPSEVVRTSSTHTTVVFLVCFFVLIITGGYSFTKWHHSMKNTVQHNFKIFIKLLLLLACSVLLMRGGWQQIPIQISVAYYSTSHFLNDIAVNTPWALMSSYLHNAKAKNVNVYANMTETAAQRLVDSSHNHTICNVKKVLTVANPNVIVFVLEGWSADVMQSTSSNTSYAPFLDSLAKRGIRFTNSYATGWTSDQGVASIVAAQPAFEVATINMQVDKLRKLTPLSARLPAGYATSFHFGGDLDYANIKGFLFEQKIQTIKDEDFYYYLPKGKLGVHDGIMLKEFSSNFDTVTPPFYAHLFTQSTHSPYDYPNAEKGSNEVKKYLDAVRYSDESFRIFFETVKSKKWFNTTLFVFISDHSHPTDKQYPTGDSRNHRIVNFWYGNVIDASYCGYVDSLVHSQNDFLATISNQLNTTAQQVPYSCNLLCDSITTTPAPIAFHGMHGFVNATSSHMKTIDNHLLNSRGNSSSTIEGDAYFQCAFQDYLNK